MKLICRITISVTLLFSLIVLAKADGSAVYNSKCASCHGKNGKGNPAMSKVLKVDNAALDLTDEATTRKFDKQLEDVTLTGEKKMPAYKGKLSEAEVKDVVKHIRQLGGVQKQSSTGPEGTEECCSEEPGAPASDKKDSAASTGSVQANATVMVDGKKKSPSAAAIKNYAAKCASCHGKTGKGNPAMAKVFKIDNSQLDLTDQATLSKKDVDLENITKKGINKMPGYAGKLTDAEISDLIAYCRSLAGDAKP